MSAGAVFDRTTRGAAHVASHRVVIDSTSHRWDVYEFPANGAPGDRPSLIFESRDAARRVRDYPADWLRLSDAELYALSWRK